MGNLKDKIYDTMVRKNADVQYEYERYVMENIKEHYENHINHWKILFKLKWHYQVAKKTERMLYFDRSSIEKQIGTQNTLSTKTENILYYLNDYVRPSVNKLAASLVDYDVISFDVFDTLIYRKVEKPNDIFHIMSAEMGCNDFMDIRKKAENMARDVKEKREGNREVVLEEIYDLLQSRFHIGKKWMDREIELEISMSMPNEYIRRVYELLVKFGKTIVFMTDMYLPLEVIRQIVEKNGYREYAQIILSNEYGLRKGDGTLQRILLEQYPYKKIVHVGDNYTADVKKTLDSGIDAIYNPDSSLVYKEPELENIAGSFYRAVIQTNINNGLWDKDIYYSHGFRVGGMLAVGFCNFISEIVKKKNIDKILFCARDCDVLYKIYKEFYPKTPVEYIKISRFAIFNITSEHYLYDLSGRYIMRYIKKYRSSKTFEMILNETGYGYLIEQLEKNNIDRFQFPASIEEKRVENFIYNCSEIIYEKNSGSREAAKLYFSEVLGEAKNILVVDIGWSGTCITALKYFINHNLPDNCCNVSGALMCTNRNDLIKNSIQFNEIEAYINTPFDNMDITRHIYPGPPKSRDIIAMNKLHMPFEYLFTSTENSLLSYIKPGEGSDGVTFEYSKNSVPNPEQIKAMQQGIIDFVWMFREYSKECTVPFRIPPYTAFLPIREAISHERYCYEVYKDFIYDALTSQYEEGQLPVFGTLFGGEYEKTSETGNKNTTGKKILFISPEMTYTGTPRSLLRMCKVAKNLGYGVEVWSGRGGIFITEYLKTGVKVKVVLENEINNNIQEIKKFDLAVCNTVVTSKYAEVCCQHIPTIWYIREATNIPDFIRNNPERAYMIKNSPDIYVVSEYAADALKPYTGHPLNVIKNCVEDEADMAAAYVPGTGEKVKFVQFGTMEYRKGYDVLLAAYKAMPETYREQSELYFAGGFINSGTPFCSYLFREMEGVKGVYYLGLIQGEEAKIKELSQKDVVVVASRDESCSLVALEGAMLSKPLIVTENVGAKYMVDDRNGYIVKTGNVESLKSAMMRLIEEKDTLEAMGVESRKKYDTMASMRIYIQSMRQLYALSETKDTKEFVIKRDYCREVFGREAMESALQEESKGICVKKGCSDAIVSLTSHPGRINIVDKCIRTLTEQTQRPKKILLWLSKEEFPGMKEDIPESLKVLQSLIDYFEIRWVDEDLKPHKKYYYTMQEYKDNPVIIVDDDVYYDTHLVEYLMDSYEKFPDCISAMRTNLMGFRRDGSIMEYEGWIMEYRVLQNTPSTQLVPTGVGGVLYPPHILPKETFRKDIIRKVCLYCDDLWLKVMASYAGVKTVMPEKFCVERLIEGSQEVALWKMNVRQGDNNDVTLKNILEYYKENIADSAELLKWLRKDRFC